MQKYDPELDCLEWNEEIVVVKNNEERYADGSLQDLNGFQ